MILPNRLRASFFVLVAAAFAALSPPAAGQAWTETDEQNVFVMGGPFSREFFGGTFRFWADHYESNFFAGAGYQRFLYAHHGGLKVGLEAGVGVRVGAPTSLELWGGGVARFDIVTIGDLSITPALTAGFSVVTDTIGEERVRASQLGEPVNFLYYLGPEISVSHAANPGLEVFGRVHHRSGGFGTIAHIDGSNAAVLGLRHKF